MADPISVTAGLGAGAALLGSLVGKPRPQDAVAAAELLDEQDPVRRTLEAIGSDPNASFSLRLIDGKEAHVERLIEIGFGAFRCITVEHVILDSKARRGTVGATSVTCRSVATIRYSAVAAVLSNERDASAKTDGE